MMNKGLPVIRFNPRTFYRREYMEAPQGRTALEKAEHLVKRKGNW